ncbi:hypothetical protein B0H10DRAFT_2046508 [Mycena sp. CBHHK59/15]|nr:hypothetical protein B0H10DRAFT_2054887 [Mycena sp. CBHHK59/15]KAJ6613984.1 hypothetical protein B0H10DRAFT_2046508 [Mycena sp. CBHHK59/15]
MLSRCWVGLQGITLIHQSFRGPGWVLVLFFFFPLRSGFRPHQQRWAFSSVKHAGHFLLLPPLVGQAIAKSRPCPDPGPRFLALVVPLQTSALLVSAPSQVKSPGTLILQTVADAIGVGFSYSILNTKNASQPAVDLTSGETAAMPLAIPFLPEGDGWVIEAKSVDFSSNLVAGTSTTFSMVRSTPGTNECASFSSAEIECRIAPRRVPFFWTIRNQGDTNLPLA